MTSSEMAERVYVQSMLELADARHDAVIESLRTDVDRLRDSWAESYGDQRRAAEERIAAGQEATRAWLANGGEDPHNGLADGARGVDATASPGLGHGHHQQPTSPYEAELQRAQELKAMDMATYAQERQRLIRADQGMF